MFQQHTLTIAHTLAVYTALIGGAWVYYALCGYLLRRTQAAHKHLLSALVGALQRPGMLVFLALAIEALPAELRDAQEALLPLQQALWILFLATFMFGFVTRLRKILIRVYPDIDAGLRSLLDVSTRIVQLAIPLLTILVCLSTYGIDITSILALGGIGGIVIGLAAKEALANILGGLILFLDHPFDVGDWIICRNGGTPIEGTVEQISWRVTRIRTFDKRALYVPNAIFTSNPIENPQRMTHRRIYETFGIRYCDAARMEAITQQVRRMLEDHAEIDSTQTLIVNFDHCGASTLDFFIYTFTHTTNWIRFHEIKQDVMLKVLDIIHGAGADCAFPTRSVILSGASPQANTP